MSKLSEQDMAAAVAAAKEAESFIECPRCDATGVFSWTAVLEDGSSQDRTGPCWACQGLKVQSPAQQRRNRNYQLMRERRAQAEAADATTDAIADAASLVPTSAE